MAAPGAGLGLQLASLMHASGQGEEATGRQHGLSFHRIPSAAPGGLSRGSSAKSLTRTPSQHQVVAPRIIGSPSAEVRDKKTAVRTSEETLVMSIASALVTPQRKMPQKHRSSHQFDMEESVAHRATSVFEYYCTRASMTNVESMGNLMFKRFLREAGMKPDTAALSECDLIFKKTTGHFQGSSGESKLVFQTFLQALARVVLNRRILQYFEQNFQPPHRPASEHDEDAIEECCSVAITLLATGRRLEPPPPATDLLSDDAVLAMQENEEVLHRLFYYYTRYTDFLMSYEKAVLFSKEFAIFPNLLNKAVLMSVYRAISPELQPLTYPGFLEFLGRVALLAFSRPGLVEDHTFAGDKLRGLFARLRVCQKMTDIITEEESTGSARYGKLPDHVLWGESEKKENANISNISPKKSFGRLNMDEIGMQRLHRSSTFRQQDDEGSPPVTTHQATNVVKWSPTTDNSDEFLQPIPESKQNKSTEEKTGGSESSDSSVERVVQEGQLEFTGLHRTAHTDSTDQESSSQTYHGKTDTRSGTTGSYSEEQYNSVVSSVQNMQVTMQDHTRRTVVRSPVSTKEASVVNASTGASPIGINESTPSSTRFSPEFQSLAKTAEPPSRDTAGSNTSYLYRSSSRVTFAAEDSVASASSSKAAYRYNSFRSLSKKHITSPSSPTAHVAPTGDTQSPGSESSTPDLEASYTGGSVPPEDSQRQAGFMRAHSGVGSSKGAHSVASSGRGGASTVSKKKASQRLKGHWSFYGQGKSTQDRVAENEERRLRDARAQQVGDSADYEMQVRVGTRPDDASAKEIAQQQLTIQAPKRSIHDFVKVDVVDSILKHYFEKFETKLKPVFEIYAGLQDPSNTSKCSFRNFQSMMKDINLFDDYVNAFDVYLQLLCVVERSQRSLVDPYRSRGTTLEEIRRLNEQSRQFETAGFCDERERDDKNNKWVARHLSFHQWFEGLVRMAEMTRQESRMVHGVADIEEDLDSVNAALAHAKEFFTYRIEPLFQLAEATKEELKMFRSAEVQRCISDEQRLLEMFFAHYSDVTNVRGDVLTHDSTLRLGDSGQEHSAESLERKKVLDFDNFLKLCYDASVVPKLAHTSVVMSAFKSAARLSYTESGGDESLSRSSQGFLGKADRLSFREFQFAVFLLAQRGFTQPFLRRKFRGAPAKLQGLFAWIRGAPGHPIEGLSRAEWERGYSYRGRTITGEASVSWGNSAFFCIGESAAHNTFGRKSGSDKTSPMKALSDHAGDYSANPKEEDRDRGVSQEEAAPGGERQESLLEALSRRSTGVGDETAQEEALDETWIDQDDSRQQALTMVLREMEDGVAHQRVQTHQTTNGHTSDPANALPDPPKHVQVPYYPSEKETFTKSTSGMGRNTRKRGTSTMTSPAAKVHRTPTTTRAPGEDYFLKRMSAAKTERMKRGWIEHLRNNQWNVNPNESKQRQLSHSARASERRSGYPMLRTASRASQKEPCSSPSYARQRNSKTSSRKRDVTSKQLSPSTMRSLSKEVAAALANGDAYQGDEFLTPRSLD
eukprot:gb/GECG01004028.1/.p1 GENE.gb/GECG01004028.1/~~gb/GECG01004028.1/.p1  ORF type:complete len:1530 (+),score=211.46 gb/GECG01004028.1/:1-4590(+)